MIKQFSAYIKDTRNNTLCYKDFDLFWKHNKKELIQVLKNLKKEIDDDMRDDPSDLPSLFITISINKDFTSWSIQTGDNSYSGSCYGDPYWGIGSLYRRSNSKDLASELISDLANQIQF